MLNLRTRRRARVDVAESGALSDLAFLLIIFFIVIAVFNINSGFLLGLPQRNSVTTVQSDDLMRVAVSAEDRLELDGEYVDVSTLRSVETSTYSPSSSRRSSAETATRMRSSLWTVVTELRCGSPRRNPLLMLKTAITIKKMINRNARSESAPDSATSTRARRRVRKLSITPPSPPNRQALGPSP